PKPLVRGSTPPAHRASRRDAPPSPSRGGQMDDHRLRRSLSSQRRLDQPFRILAVPFGRASQTTDLAALGVDQKSRRQADGLQLRGGACCGIRIELKCLDADLVEELLRLLDAAPIDAQRHYLEAL